MNKFLSVIAVLIGFSIVAIDAEAARVGGGRNVGTQRSSPATTNQAAPAQKTAPAQAAPAPAAPQKSGMSRWLGPLAGLAAGIGIASLLSSMGMGGALASMLGSLLMIALLAGAAFFIYRMVTRNKTSQSSSPLQYAGAGSTSAPASNAPAPAPLQQPAQFTGNAAPGSLAATLGGAAAAPEASRWPADFDAPEFERQALMNFQRVQAANDAGDAATLRDFLTPELYREIEAEMKSAWGTPQKTEAVDVKSEVLEVVTEGDRYIVSVRFTGQIRENGTLNTLNEIWHLEKPVTGRSGWRVSGIQQAQ
jgi:predicted lipid-binding transport protein (Tim44 family)